jgi:hypothetical protein
VESAGTADRGEESAEYNREDGTAYRGRERSDRKGRQRIEGEGGRQSKEGRAFRKKRNR